MEKSFSDMERNSSKVNGNPDCVKLYIHVPWRSGYIAVHFNIGIMTNDSYIL